MQEKYNVYLLSARNRNYSGKSWRTKTLKRLIKKYGLICQYCGTTLLVKKDGNGRLDLNHATVDHVYSNLDIRRFLCEHVVKLACHKCNNDKVKKENKEILYNDDYNWGNLETPNVLINLLMKND